MSNSDYINQSDYHNLPKYPGMCRPYSRNNNNTIVHAKHDKMANATINPFSIYDDDSATNEPHHFLVPAISKDMAKFKRTFKELNQNKLNTTRIHSDNIKTRHIHKQCVKTNRSCSLKENESLLKKPDISGDYCTLSRLSKPSLSNNTFCKKNIKNENLKDFASRFVTTDDIDLIKQDERKIELAHTRRSLRKSKKHKINRIIDICTCMACVKSVSYQYTGDDTDEYVRPCSCAGGSSKSVACRWLCLAPLALILPCLLCYPPAKLCQKACSNESCRTRLKSPVEENETYEARYVRDPTENTTFL